MKEDKRLQKKNLIIKSTLKLFAENGYYNTSIPDIAKALKMSVGNMYNYFKSKEILGKEIIIFVSKYLGKEIRKINDMDISTKEKTRNIVKIYFTTAIKKPEMIDYFLRIYLAKRDIFKDGCEGMICVNEFVTEIIIYFEEGVKKGDLRDQDFYVAFGLFMGYLCGMVFLDGEKILPQKLEYYLDDVTNNIYKALES